MTSSARAMNAGSGSTGDADLYVRKGSAPTDTTYDCRPHKASSTERCTFKAPSGDYYVNVVGYTAFTNVTLKGSY